MRKACVEPIEFDADGLIKEVEMTSNGADWYDEATGEKLAGGQTVLRRVTLKDVPRFVRAGSVMPVGPEVQWSGERPWDDLEIRVYPGADGEFALYEDDFTTYAYEKGEYSKIPFRWRDSTRELEIGAQEGAYPAMLKTRTFRVVLPGGVPVTVAYDGTPRKLSL